MNYPQRQEFKGLTKNQLLEKRTQAEENYWACIALRRSRFSATKSLEQDILNYSYLLKAIDYELEQFRIEKLDPEKAKLYIQQHHGASKIKTTIGFRPNGALRVGRRKRDQKVQELS